jgi:hypothetical protein
MNVSSLSQMLFYLQSEQLTKQVLEGFGHENTEGKVNRAVE